MVERTTQKLYLLDFSVFLKGSHHLIRRWRPLLGRLSVVIERDQVQEVIGNLLGDRGACQSEE